MGGRVWVVAERYMPDESGTPAWVGVAMVFLLIGSSVALAAKPVVAIFPLGGSAAVEMREKVAFSFRAKLDRQGTYTPIDGPTMGDVAGDAAIDFSTPASRIEELAAAQDESRPAAILLWGELDEKTLKLHVLDKRQTPPQTRDIEKKIAQPTDLRFAVEQVLQTLPGIPPFEHPSEVAVQDDPAARAAFASQPNLVTHGDFEGADASGAWQAMLRDELYPPPTSDQPPDVDRVAITQDPGAPKAGRVLAMNLSKDVAESNGLTCQSNPISILPGRRYRLQFRYRSDGPSLHVFVKGFGSVDGENRELYRRQVPPSGATDGKWVTVTDDLNPQNGRRPVTTLRIDLYAYLKPGGVMFDDVVLKDVGVANHVTSDEGVKTSPH